MKRKFLLLFFIFAISMCFNQSRVMALEETIITSAYQFRGDFGKTDITKLGANIDLSSYNNNYGLRQQRVSKTQGKKVIGLKGNRTLLFNSANEAERYFTGKKGSNISQCANGKLETAYGYKWGWV